jgi:hypothetical protein
VARCTFAVDISTKWRPGLAPWRGHEILICARDAKGQPISGTPLRAGEPIEIPTDLVFVADFDFTRMFPGGVQWLDGMPDTDELEAQRQTATRYSQTGHIPADTVFRARHVQGSPSD